MAEFTGTPGPWKASNRNWRNEPDPHSWYVTGDHHEAEPDDGEEDFVPGEVCTAVCVVPGNPTSAPVTEKNARLIEAAPDLLAVVKAMLPEWERAERCEASADDGLGDRLRMLRRVLHAAKVAIAKATGGSGA